MAKKKRRRFTAEYKKEVVELIRKSGKSPGQVARELDLTETSVRAWMKQADVDDSPQPEGPLTTEEKEELRRLRREVKRLEMERDILKKAATFFAKESE